MMHQLALLAVAFLLLIHPLPLDSTLSKSDVKKKKAAAATSAAVPPCETLVTERGLVTEKPVYKDILQNHLAYSLPQAKTKNFPLPTLAFVSPANSKGYEHVKTFGHKFSHVAAGWLQLRPAKTDTGFAVTGEQLLPQDWLANMKSHTGGAPAVPRLMFDGWTSEDFNSLFTNQYVANGCCAAIVRHLQRHGFNGVALDIWSMLMGHRMQDLVHFVQHLGRDLHSDGLLLVLVVPPPLVNARQHSGLFGKREFDSLLDSVDFFSLATNDYHAMQQPQTRGGSSGGVGLKATPTSPIAWLRACVEVLAPAAAATTSRSQQRAKILLGLNFYGYDHVTGDSQLIDGQGYLALLKKHRPELAWSAEHQEHFISYSTGIGSHVISYPTLASLKARIELAKSLGTGIAIWDIGQGLDYFFDLL